MSGRGYDPTKRLVIDPAVFVNAGYIGGAFGQGAGGIAVADFGSAYVVDGTDSSDFPAATGPDTAFQQRD